MSKIRKFQCHCGAEHELDSENEADQFIIELIETLGEDIKVTSNGISYKVPRIFMVNHSLIGKNLSEMGFEKWG